MTEKLLIVGGTGFIGKNLAQKAVDNGFTTTVVSLNMPKQVYQVSGVKYFQANITNLDQLKEIFISSSGALPKVPDELFTDDANLLNPSSWSGL